jgi:hypothetical protein
MGDEQKMEPVASTEGGGSSSISGAAVKGSFRVAREGLRGYFFILARTQEEAVQQILVAAGYQKFTPDPNIDSDWKIFDSQLSGAFTQKGASQASALRFKIGLEEALKLKSPNRTRFFEGLRSKDAGTAVEGVLNDIFHNLAAGDIELKVAIEAAQLEEPRPKETVEPPRAPEEAETSIEVIILSDPVGGKSASNLKFGDRILVRIDAAKPSGLSFAQSMGAYKDGKMEAVLADVILTHQEEKSFKVTAYFVEQHKKCVGYLESPEIKVRMAVKEEASKPRDRGWWKIAVAVLGGLIAVLAGIGIYLYFFG